jgi:hypothetical protein
MSQIGVMEQSGNNDGPQIRDYLATTGLPEGHPWCAAFVSWVYGQCGVINPSSAWSPSYFPGNKTIHSNNITYKQPERGDVFGIYFTSLQRIAHVGFIHRWGDRLVTTVEGNTNDENSREGNRVAVRRRPTRTIYKVSRFIVD